MVAGLHEVPVWRRRPALKTTEEGGTRASVERLEGRQLLSAAATHGLPTAAADSLTVLAKEFVHVAHPDQVRYTFSQDVQASLAAQDLEVTNLSTGAAFTAASVAYDGGSNRATFVLPASLPNGAYLASLPARSVADTAGNSMASEEALEFFVLAGDVNRDRRVDSTDFALLAGNFGRTGRTYGQGDLNADTLVNSSDFALLAGNFGKAVPVVTITYDSAGFEAPRFTPNQDLSGQDPVHGPWLPLGGAGTAVVQTTTPGRGQQSVRVTRAADPDGDSRWIVSAPTTVPATGVVNIDVDMSVVQSTGFAFGPVFGVEAYDASGPVAKLIGSLTLDAATGDVLYQEAGTRFLLETGTVVARGSYHQYRLSVNFADKTYSVFVDGALLHTEGFVDNTAVAFTDAPLATLAATDDTVATATGTAFFDNYRISQTPAQAGAAAAPTAAIRAANSPSRTSRPAFAPRGVGAVPVQPPTIAGTGKAASATAAGPAARRSPPVTARARAAAPLPRRQVPRPILSIARGIVPLRDHRSF